MNRRLYRWPTREERQTFCKELESVMRLVPDDRTDNDAKEYLNEAAHLLRRFSAMETSSADVIKELADLKKRGEKIFIKEDSCG
jgi:hypothetical protein